MSSEPGANADSALRNEVRRLLAAGRQMEALKLYQQQTGAGLSEAREAIEILARTPPGEDPAVLRNDDRLDQLDPRLEQQIVDLLRTGSKLQAVKFYHEQTKVGLNESKKIVDAVARSHGMDKGSGCTVSTARLLAVVAALIFAGRQVSDWLLAGLG